MAVNGCAHPVLSEQTRTSSELGPQCPLPLSRAETSFLPPFHPPMGGTLLSQTWPMGQQYLSPEVPVVEAEWSWVR